MATKATNPAVKGHPSPNEILEEWLNYYDEVNRRRASHEKLVELLNLARSAMAPLIDKRRTQIDPQSKLQLATIAAVRAAEAINLLNDLLAKDREELAAIRQEVLPPK